MTVVCFPDDFTVHPGTAYVHEAPLDTFFFTQVSFHLIPTVPSCCFFLHFKQQLRGRQCLTVKVMNDSHCDPGTHDVSVTLKVINSDPRQLCHRSVSELYLRLTACGQKTTKSFKNCL